MLENRDSMILLAKKNYQTYDEPSSSTCLRRKGSRRATKAKHFEPKASKPAAAQSCRDAGVLHDIRNRVPQDRMPVASLSLKEQLRGDDEGRFY